MIYDYILLLSYNYLSSVEPKGDILFYILMKVWNWNCESPKYQLSDLFSALQPIEEGGCE